jgi:hypothetical protein
MKIKNINKKLLAGLLGTVMLTTPLGLTACGSNYTNNHIKSTQDEVSKSTQDEVSKSTQDEVSKSTQDEVSNSTKEYRYGFYIVKELKIITIKSVKGNKVMLVEKVERHRNGFHYCYFDVFSGVEFKASEVRVFKEEDLIDYLIAYDYLQTSYSLQELKYFFEKIKPEICIDEKSNELVKK